MDLGLNGKVAMVAASSKGIGLATAQLLAAEGCRVSICARNEAELAAAAAKIGPGCHYSVVDVTKAEDLERWHQEAVTALGPVSILVTNTGGPPAGALANKTDAEWQTGFDTTLMNVVRLVRTVGESMKKQGWGRIVHVTSLVAKEPSRLLPISSTLRAGLFALTRLQSTELAPFGVTVNAVLPGHTLTDRQRHLAEIRAARENIDPEEALRRQGAEVPVGRLATPEEIAAAIVFLCSAQAAYVSGVSMLVDGGLTRGLS